MRWLKKISRAFNLAYGLLLGNAALARRLGVSMGRDCRLYIRDFGSEPFLISMGSRVTIAPGAKLVTHDGSSILVRNENGKRYQIYGKINIGDDVFVGTNAIILPGVKIGSRSVIGAGSVVTKDVAEGSVVAGNPARRLRDYADFERDVRSKGVLEVPSTFSGNHRSRVFAAINGAKK